MAHQLGLVAAARGALPGDLADRLSPHATVLRSRGGRLLLNVGAPSTSVHLVLEGRVQVVVCSGNGGEVILRDLAAGDLFGELSAIDGRPRSTSIVALGDCTVASIPGPAFRDAACATPEGALWLARRLTAQVRGLTERILELNTLRVPARLHCELLRLSIDDPETGGRTIDPAPTHADLAARVGTHPNAEYKHQCVHRWRRADQRGERRCRRIGSRRHALLGRASSESQRHGPDLPGGCGRVFCAVAQFRTADEFVQLVSPPWLIRPDQTARYRLEFSPR